MENICTIVDDLLKDNPANVVSDIVRWHLVNCPICSRHGQTTQELEGWNPKALNNTGQSELPGMRKCS